MKTILTIAIVLMGWMAQAQHPIEYYYDANGSRILRKAVVIKSMDDSAKDTLTAQQFLEAQEESLLAGKTSESESQTLNQKEGVSQLIADREIVIYPNPTQGNLLLQLGDVSSIQQGRVTLHDLSGKLLIEKCVTEMNL